MTAHQVIAEHILDSADVLPVGRRITLLRALAVTTPDPELSAAVTATADELERAERGSRQLLLNFRARATPPPVAKRV